MPEDYPNNLELRLQARRSRTARFASYRMEGETASAESDVDDLYAPADIDAEGETDPEWSPGMGGPSRSASPDPPSPHKQSSSTSNHSPIPHQPLPTSRDDMDQDSTEEEPLDCSGPHMSYHSTKVLDRSLRQRWPGIHHSIESNFPSVRRSAMARLTRKTYFRRTLQDRLTAKGYLKPAALSNTDVISEEIDRLTASNIWTNAEHTLSHIREILYPDWDDIKVQIWPSEEQGGDPTPKAEKRLWEGRRLQICENVLRQLDLSRTPSDATIQETIRRITTGLVARTREESSRTVVVLEDLFRRCFNAVWTDLEKGMDAEGRLGNQQQRLSLKRNWSRSLKRHFAIHGAEAETTEEITAEILRHASQFQPSGPWRNKIYQAYENSGRKGPTPEYQIDYLERLSRIVDSSKNEKGSIMTASVLDCAAWRRGKLRLMAQEWAKNQQLTIEKAVLDSYHHHSQGKGNYTRGPLKKQRIRSKRRS